MVDFNECIIKKMYLKEEKKFELQVKYELFDVYINVFIVDLKICRRK